MFERETDRSLVKPPEEFAEVATLSTEEKERLHNKLMD